MGYGGANPCAWHNNEEYYTKTMFPNSIFGKPLLQLISVCWMGPYVVVENIPISWKKLDIDIHHVYMKGCSLNGVNTCVTMHPMSTINGEEEHWVDLELKPFPR